MIISVCIATYKRERLLEKLLKSLLAQEVDQDVILQIIVVDNDAMGSAANIVNRINSELLANIEYYIQPKKNISLTRNEAIIKSKGHYILFIDDDEEADKKWINSFLVCMEKYKADGAFGCVIPNFHPNAPRWLVESDFYKRPCPETGSSPIYMGTGNCIISSRIVKETEILFDESYGLTGGEDVHFFSRIKNKGYKLVACKEAIVKEYMPLDRVNLKWLLLRSYQTGNSYTRRIIELSKYPNFQRIHSLFRSIIYLGFSVILFIILIFSQHKRTKALIKIFSNLGHINAVLGIYKKSY